MKQEHCTCVFKMVCTGACKCDCRPSLSRPVEKFTNNARQNTKSHDTKTQNHMTQVTRHKSHGRQNYEMNDIRETCFEDLYAPKNEVLLAL